MYPSFKNVLVVDDSEITRQVLCRGLCANGYHVSSAEHGAEALSIILDSPPDFVITDWHMPNMTGQMLCRAIRSADLYRYVYVVMMTADFETIDVVEGLAAGADDYITKPVALREISAKLVAGSRVLELDRRLTSAAECDALTGVLNRRSLTSNMGRLFRHCERLKQPVSMIMVDIDHFKSINDRHGHLAGDAILVRIAEILKGAFRSSDHIYRFGGEEFVVLLPNCDLTGAALCAERCRAEIESHKFVDALENVTASSGIAERQPDELPMQLLDRADGLLYASKSKGRNLVTAGCEWREAASADGIERLRSGRFVEI